MTTKSAGVALAWFLGMQAMHSPAQAAWRFEVEPAVKGGRPAVIARASAETSTGIRATVFALTEQTSRVLQERTFAPAPSIRVEAPVVEAPTPIEIVCSTDAPTPEPMFRWRTVALPRGQRLLDYRGRRGFDPPKDFDDFWKQAKRELAAVPLEPLIERVADKDTTTGLLHKVVLPSVGQTKIVCWYYVPRAAFDEAGRVRQKFPAVIIMPGYGAEEPPLDRTASGIITLSVNPRNHGPSRQFWKAPQEHLLWNIDQPSSFYYRAAFLDCLRAAEFLFTRAEVDPHRVAAEGGSQGGLFALALGALEPRIACVASNVTAFSAYADAMLLATTGHQVQYAAWLREHASSASLARRSLAYTDGANLARRIRCPVQINMGGVDPVCNYVAGIVVYNRIPRGVPKEYHVIPDVAHAVPPLMREWNERWYRKWWNLP